MNLIILRISVFLPLLSIVLADGQRDYGEPCSLRSQIANYFRENDSAQGCMTDKGLVCISHKCVCDPTSVYVQSLPSGSDSGSSGGVRATIGNFLVKKFTGSGGASTTPPTASTSGGASGGASVPASGGRCLGRSGSPCLTDKSACVEHAVCEGSPRICRCQGIYSSNTVGMCSKRATVAQEALKRITG